MKKLTVYLEKVPTKDLCSRETDCDIYVWEDKEKTKRKCIIPWFHKSKPDKRYKYITLNCCKWNIEWI